MKQRFIDSTILRFLIVGIVNTIVGCGIMFLLYNWAGCSYWLSSSANYVAGGICSFFLNKYFTFQNYKSSWKQVGRFILTVAICYFFAYGLAKPFVYMLISEWPVKKLDNIAMLVGMCLYTILNYLGQRCVVFHESHNR